MASFVTAYLAVWAFVALYLLRLRADHRRLARRIQTLENLVGERGEESQHSRAA